MFAYKALVINQAVGPKAKDIEIVLPTILAIIFTGIQDYPIARST